MKHDTNLGAAPRYCPETGPSTTVCIVNYNSNDLLESCLESLRAQTRRDFEVIVVDNGSVPPPPAHEGVDLIKLPHNVGFAEANNIALRSAELSKSKYIAFLNPDTTVSPNWIGDLVGTLDEDDTIAAISAMLVFMPKFVELEFIVQATYCPAHHGDSEDRRDLGIRVNSDVTLSGCAYPKRFYGAGWWPPERDWRWSQKVSRLLLPVPEDADPILILQVTGHSDGARFKVCVGDWSSGEYVAHEDTLRLAIALPREVVQKSTVDVVNNFGSFVDNEGFGHDVGFGLRADQPLFHREWNPPSLCAANMIARRALVEDVGGMWPKYWTYYEDTELSVRMCAKGWQLAVSPRSRVRHVHSATAKVSLRRDALVERNRMLFLHRNGLPQQQAWLRRWAVVGLFRSSAALLLLRHGRRDLYYHRVRWHALWGFWRQVALDVRK